MIKFQLCFSYCGCDTSPNSENVGLLESYYLHCHEPSGTYLLTYFAYPVYPLVCITSFLMYLMQFRGAFKRFVKSRDEKELERRWTRINRNAPEHFSLVRTNSRLRSPMRNRQKQSKRARFINVIKNPTEISSRGDWSNPNCIDCKYSIHLCEKLI